MGREKNRFVHLYITDIAIKPNSLCRHIPSCLFSSENK